MILQRGFPEEITPIPISSLGGVRRQEIPDSDKSLKTKPTVSFTREPESSKIGAKPPSLEPVNSTLVLSVWGPNPLGWKCPLGFLAGAGLSDKNHLSLKDQMFVFAL